MKSKRAKRWQRTLLVPSWLCVCACVPSLEGNKPREPSREVPAGFSQGGEKSGGGPTTEAQKTWDDFFTDPHLRELIGQALKNNKELDIRLQEIIVRRSEITERKGEYLPKVDAQAGAGIEKVGRHTSQGVSDEAHGVDENLPNFRFGLVSSWEVDVWKKLRNAAKAARLRYMASIEARNFVITQLVAELANSYFELRALDNQLKVLDSNIAIQKNALEVVRLQKEAGRVTELAVQRFEAEVLTNQSRRFELQQRMVEVENSINFLVGRFPGPVKRREGKLDDALSASLAVGLPAQLLENRPDVRQAELELQAAKLDVEVAKARFYPSLSLEAGVGYEAFDGRYLVTTPESVVYNAAANLTVPLLNRNAIKAQYRAANARQIQTVLEYEQTLLAAYTEVVNRLSMIKNLKERYLLQAQQVDRLVRSIEVSGLLFRSARADYMEVLLTRRDALDAEMELIETRQRQIRAMVEVYQALGGGWRSKG